MKPTRSFLIILALLASLTFTLWGQRKITPVQPKSVTSAGQQPPKENTDVTSHLAEMKDAQGNIVLVDTITGKEWIDTTNVNKGKGMIYPLFESVTMGVNIWDPVMRLLGQHYGGADIWAELSLHNRYKPVLEFGLGSCNDTPDGMNYTFKTKLAPYFRIGMNYNMFYNNNPRYQLVVGVRYGFTPFSYEVTDISIPPGYWGEPSTLSIPSQSTTAGFFELVAGVRVMIAKQISLGWTAKYHTILHEGAHRYGELMYIPGFGKRGSTFTGSFSISYTLPLNKPAPGAVNTDKK